MAKYVMLIDIKRCIGCHTCAVACKQEHNLPNNVWWNQVFSGEVSDFTGNKESFTYGALKPNANLSIDVAKGELASDGGLVNSPAGRQISMNFYTKACQHCDEPVCVKVCPTEALYKDPATGIVGTYFDLCIGCGICMQECPYDVRHLNDVSDRYYNDAIGGVGINKHLANIVDKCTFCSHRVARGEQPACVTHCIAQARHFGNLYDASSSIHRLLNSRQTEQLLPEKGTKPSVYFLK